MYQKKWTQKIVMEVKDKGLHKVFSSIVPQAGKKASASDRKEKKAAEKAACDQIAMAQRGCRLLGKMTKAARAKQKVKNAKKGAKIQKQPKEKRKQEVRDQAMKMARDQLAVEEAETKRKRSRREAMSKEPEVKVQKSDDANNATSAVKRSAEEMLNLVHVSKRLVAQELVNSRTRATRAAELQKEIEKQQKLGMSRIRAQVSGAKRTIKSFVTQAKKPKRSKAGKADASVHAPPAPKFMALKPPKPAPGGTVTILLDGEYACEACEQLYTSEDYEKQETACKCGHMMVKLSDIEFSTSPPPVAQAEKPTYKVGDRVQVATEQGPATRAGQLATILEIDSSSGTASLFMPDVGASGITAKSIETSTLRPVCN